MPLLPRLPNLLKQQISVVCEQILSPGMSAMLYLGKYFLKLKEGHVP